MVDTADDAGRDVYREVGPHLRHCLDHFECLLQGLDSGLVDYDARDRREILERDPDSFLEAMASIVTRLERLDSDSIRHTLRLRQEATPGAVAEVESSLERELIFLSGHTIHHIAIVRLLAEASGFRLPPDLDVAYSTATYQREATRDVAAGS
jgi:hypothetical protein